VEVEAVAGPVGFEQDRPPRWWRRFVRPPRRELTVEDRRAMLDELFFEGPELPPYLFRLATLMGLSALIAALGLIEDSPAVVIGAMLVAPLMTPLMAFAASLVMGWARRQLIAAVLVAAASAEAVGLAFAVSAVVPAFRPVLVSQELLSRTEPKLLDLGIAIAAGAAGAYVTVHRRAAGALPGVAIAVALVPPLAAVGVLLDLDRVHLAAGAALLYATNLAAIVLAATVVFLATGFVPRALTDRRGRRITLGLLTALLAVAAVAYPLQRESRAVLQKAQDEQTLSQAIVTWLGGEDLQVTDATVDEQAGRLAVTVDVAGAKPPPAAQTLAGLLSGRIHRPVQLAVRWTQQRQELATAVGP
jgi:uncharacterized hydrophobic protein (TIGR00271 family)